MSVVLRCPACGTTRAVPGECEACHDAQVRYFCTNHTPGQWVDAPTCPRCGSRFGEARRTPAAMPAPPPRPRSPEPVDTSGWTSPPPPSSRRVEAPPDRDEWEPRGAPPPGPRAGFGPGVSPLALLLNILNASARARRTVPLPTPGHTRRAPGCGVFGCLMQVVLLVASVLGALFLFGW